MLSFHFHPGFFLDLLGENFSGGFFLCEPSSGIPHSLSPTQVSPTSGLSAGPNGSGGILLLNYGANHSQSGMNNSTSNG